MPSRACHWGGDRDPHQSLTTAKTAHAVLLDQEERWAFVPHTQANAIFQFRYDGTRGVLAPAPVPQLTLLPKTGPRHIVFHPAADIVYACNESGRSVTAFAFSPETGTLSPFQSVSTVPEAYRGPNFCADIRISPSGEFLFVSNRGHDSVACFRTSLNDGRLSSIGQKPAERMPWSLDLDADGRFLYVAGTTWGRLSAYRINPTTGDLSRHAIYEVGDQPRWVRTVRLAVEPK